MEGAEQDRSEKPSQFKLEHARKKGSVARGADLGFLIALAAFTLYLWVAGRGFAARLADMSRDGLVTAPQVAGGPHELFAVSAHLFESAARPVALLAAAVFAAVLLFELAQTGFVFTGHPLKPDFSRLNPAKGLKRVFSKRMLVETFKNVLKLAIYSAIAWFVARRAVADTAASVGDAAGLAGAMFAAAMRLLAFFALAALAFAALDQLLVRKDFLKNMRMSRRELRREMRDREGEPRLKQRRRELHGEFVKASESLRNVRGADVVITNPVHYAVALRYEADGMAAPQVVARGANAMAQRIKKLAFVYGVPIVEDKALARALYRRCGIESPVPEAQYREVAAVYTALRARPVK